MQVVRRDTGFSSSLRTLLFPPSKGRFLTVTSIREDHEGSSGRDDKDGKALKWLRGSVALLPPLQSFADCTCPIPDRFLDDRQRIAAERDSGRVSDPRRLSLARHHGRPRPVRWRALCGVQSQQHARNPRQSVYVPLLWPWRRILGKYRNQWCHTLPSR